jgi:hypothetical protein
MLVPVRFAVLLSRSLTQLPFQSSEFLLFEFSIASGQGQTPACGERYRIAKNAWEVVFTGISPLKIPNYLRLGLRTMMASGRFHKIRLGCFPKRSSAPMVSMSPGPKLLATECQKASFNKKMVSDF